MFLHADTRLEAGWGRAVETLPPRGSWAAPSPSLGDPSRKYLWILSLSPEMDATTYESLAATARHLGFDPARLVRTPHTAP